MKNYKNGFATIIISLIIAALALGGGTYFYSKNKNRSDVNTNQTSDWKTYKNEKYGYQLNYPANWDVRENQTNFSVQIFNPEAQGKPDTDQPSEAVSIFFAQESSCKSSNWEIGFGQVFYRTSCLLNHPTVLVGMVAFSEQTKSLEEQIFSTFKFTELNTSVPVTSISGWKTYKNEKYGFEFRYPADRTPYNSFDSRSNVLHQVSSDAGLVVIAEDEKKVFCCEPVTLSISTAEFAGKQFGSIDAKHVIVDGYPAVQFDGAGSLDSVYKRIIVDKNGLIVTIEQNAKSLLLDKILSTFKFTGSNGVQTSTNEQKALARAREVLQAVSARDYQKLETFVSSDGLSLDQYPHFDSKKNPIAKSEVSLIPKDTKIYLWGYTDGRGDPINLTRAEFLTKSIYSNSVDYLNAPNVAVNKKLGGGNSINTIENDVAGRTYVAFYFSGFDQKYGGMDWTTLYVIFDSVNGEYMLRGIAKDNWTI